MDGNTATKKIAKGKCRSCGKEIAFIPTPAGKLMPVDWPGRTITQLKLGESIVLENGTVVRNPHIGMGGFTPHWGTCDNPNKFRNSPKEAK